MWMREEWEDSDESKKAEEVVGPMNTDGPVWDVVEGIMCDNVEERWG